MLFDLISLFKCVHEFLKHFFSRDIQRFFSPDHFVDDANIGLNDFHDLVGNVFVSVVGDGDGAAVFLLADHLDGGIDGLQESFCVNTGEDEAGFVECFGAFG